MGHRGLCRLTVRQVQTAQPGFVCDGGNLWLQTTIGVDGKLRRSWVFRYATGQIVLSSTGKRRRVEKAMGLGSVETVSLLEAREKAADARKLLGQDIDPLETKRAHRASMVARETKFTSFDEAAKKYLRKYEDGWKNRVHRQQWRNTLRDYVVPVLGKRDVRTIDTAVVLKVLSPIWERIPETAARVRGRIEAVLDFAKVEIGFAWQDGGNPARWSGHLEHCLKARKQSTKRLPALSWREMPAFISELRGMENIAARALEFTILCATRREETVGAVWREIDLDARTWTIPLERLKRKGEQEDGSHCIPLSDAALGVLRALDEIRQDDRIFPIGLDDMLTCLKELRAELTVHGFRATFRSWAGACTNHPRDVCETALGHPVGDASERAYMRDALLAKRRKLMDEWAAFCDSAIVRREAAE
jgi:integrase